MVNEKKTALSTCLAIEIIDNIYYNAIKSRLFVVYIYANLASKPGKGQTPFIRYYDMTYSTYLYHHFPFFLTQYNKISLLLSAELCHHVHLHLVVFNF